jgi:molybdate transport system substrate-binding protein
VFDVAILTEALVDGLIARRVIVGGTCVVVARSAIGLAIRAGAPKPDIRTTEALTRALRASAAIAFAKEGAGGLFFAALMERLALPISRGPS